MTQGIETNTAANTREAAPTPAMVVTVGSRHQRLIQVELLDVTDRNNQLVHTREWLLHNKDTDLSLAGNLFAVECTLTGQGKLFVKRAPLPHVRAADGPVVDLGVTPHGAGGFDYALHQTGADEPGAWAVLDFEGGAPGRTRVLHRWQQSLRPQTDSHRVPTFLSNSWGDRNRDSRIQEAFLLQEIDRAAELGVEVVQIDDGWQKGRSANSAEAKEKGGIWSGFWDSDPEFWTPDPVRFPNGLKPLIERALARGVAIGLWYAPDSWQEFRNWRRDARQIVALHREYGVNHFKLDSITAETVTARRNLAALFKTILEQSAGRIVCDLDITAGKRPGYFGELAIGPLFVENRYTDWHNYWPHFTLRNLWQLSHWVEPWRLRMELLNNARNDDKYNGDPLAPSRYPPATLFASVMFANPLGWFENTGLSDDYVGQVAPLVACWKAHRDRIFAGDILPIGDAPDGVAWTGFVSCGDGTNGGYAVVFNEKNPATSHRFELPRSFAAVEVLSGAGEARLEGQALVATLAEPFGYLFVRLKDV